MTTHSHHLPDRGASNEETPSLFAARWHDDVAACLQGLGATPVERERLIPQVIERALAQEEELAGGKVRGVLRRAALDAFSQGLVETARAGDSHATHRLLDAWQVEILRWCRWQCPRGLNHEDVAQDVMVAVMSRLHAVREPNRFRAWLWGVTWRTVQAKRRKAWFWRWVPGEAEQHVDALDDPTSGLERNERSQTVQRVLDKVDPVHRQLLWLCYVEGQTRRELVALLGMPEGTLNRRLTAARRAFEKLAREHGLGPDGQPTAPEVVHG